ncbi:alpha-amylase family glycosyl hydrolase [Spongiimicrobium salis]|uniref:alpha-amylase family glycosyl hydrolase n=1 Tax=Spongiimicrobium salis TaxID=1667022 RepID=UPI00374D3C05
MKKNASFLLLLLFSLQMGIGQLRELPFIWENATVYFVLTDRFENGDPSNDFSYGRQDDGAPLRSYQGGDLQGLINKINEGYFDELGVNAIWITPPYENIHGSTDEGVGQNYAFHGYWAKDWTTIDLNLGTEQLFQTFVDTAHDHGIRVVMDVVLNHVGPDNPADEPWPNDWVRRDPTCNFQGPGGTIPCELVDNLPDIRTESNAPVSLPQWLLDKWSNEGRRAEEEAELNAFFNRTGYPRAPRFYIIKWLTDYVRKYGVDGFRIDTVKHVEESVWGELKTEGLLALQEWKSNNPTKKLDDRPFWMTGEVFNYFALSMQRTFTGDGFNVDYFNNGYENLINFGFRFDANNGLESLFSSYNNLQQNQLGAGNSVMNFLANHDTQEVFDRNRIRTFEAGTKLLLSPATAQLYYGDETARTLTPGGGVEGDATLRSFMNFGDLQDPNSVASLTLLHHQRIGKFRREHVAVGGGIHALVQNTPYAFKREYNKNGLNDKVLVYTGNDGDFNTSLNLFNLWPDDTVLLDYFSGNTATVSNNTANFNTNFGLVLIGEPFQSVTPQPPNSYVINVKKPQDWNEINAYFFNKATNSTLGGTTDFPGEVTSLLTGSNIWYTYTLTVPAGVDPNDVGIVFNNRNNGSQSVDLMRNREGWFEFTSGGALRNGFWSDNCPSECPDTTTTDTFRVFAQKPGDWNTIFAYTFNTAQNSTLGGTADWPGQQMTKLAGTNAWYFYDVVLPEGVSSSEIGLVLNNGNNGSQSIDLFRDREGWFNFTSGGSVRNGNWNDNCTFDCPSASLQTNIAPNSENGIIVFPNPISGNGSMAIQMEKVMPVKIVIYDLLGREVKTVYDAVMPTGTNTVKYGLRQSGTYIYNVIIGTEKYSGKLVVN